MATAALVRCHDCRRPVVRSEPLRDWENRPYGPKCGKERGLRRDRRVRARAPRRSEVVQPVLDGLEEINDEENGEL